MTSLVGKKLFIFFTGAELPMAIPINDGKAMGVGQGFYTLLGEVTGETHAGIWFRLEKIFAQNHSEMKVDFSEKPEYLVAWAMIRRALLAKNEADQELPKHFGFNLPKASR